MAAPPAAAVYGLVVGAPAPAARGVPYVFDPDDITNPYAMTWTAYSTKLKPFLDGTYQAAAPARAARAPAPAAAPAGAPPAAAPAGAPPAAAPAAPAVIATSTQAKNRIRALNGGTPGVFPAGLLPAGWNQGHVNGIINRADLAVPPDIKNAVPFNQAQYDAAMLAWLNTDANQRWHAGPPVGTPRVVFSI